MNKRQILKFINKIVHPIRSQVLLANYKLNNYKEVLWLIGDGRSGTTWVSNLINYNKEYRDMFEPFHPKIVKEASFLLPDQYVRAEDTNDQLEKFANEVFSGRFTHLRVDPANRSISYKGLLIKDIYANLFSYWVYTHFENVKIVLLIRNPFSVALSKYKIRDWFWMNDPMSLLNQPKLYEDYLQPFEDIIIETSKKNDFILNQILIWSIINYIPIRQFSPGQIHIVFYEDIFTNPNLETSKILQFSKGNIDINLLKLDEKTIKHHNRVMGTESNIIKGKSPITSWKNELSSTQIENGQKILDCFGFAELYNDESMPNRFVLDSIHSQGLK